MIFGELVKSRRIKLGLTQTSLSELSGVSQSAISKIEAGRFSPKLSDAERICEALGMKIEVRSKK